MKLVACSDIHGSYGRLNDILAKEQPFDGLIIAGDLTTLGAASEAAEALSLFAAHGHPIYIVAGNMDPVPLEKTFAEHATLIDGRGVLHNDVGLFGVSGSPPTPFRTPYEISEEEILRRASSGWDDIASARISIFVPHPPPLNTRCDTTVSGMHVGSSGVRTFVEQHQPDVCVCGHIHESRGTDLIGKTHIINCGPVSRGYYAVVTVGLSVSVELRG